MERGISHQPPQEGRPQQLQRSDSLVHSRQSVQPHHTEHIERFSGSSSQWSTGRVQKGAFVLVRNRHPPHHNRAVTRVEFSAVPQLYRLWKRIWQCGPRTPMLGIEMTLDLHMLEQSNSKTVSQMMVCGFGIIWVMIEHDEQFWRIQKEKNC